MAQENDLNFLLAIFMEKSVKELEVLFSTFKERAMNLFILIMQKAKAFFFIILLLATSNQMCLNAQQPKKVAQMLEDIRQNRDNPEVLKQLLPIVRCDFKSTKYEELLLTQIRDVNTSMEDFRLASDKLAGLLVAKVMAILPTQNKEIKTPLTNTHGIVLNCNINLVSIMRSGDALLETYIEHFPQATISKILIQRDETTAEPNFKYMKLSPSLGPDSIALITEPMIATGGTLSMVINLLKQKGVREENIIIASVCTAPEGLLSLSQKHPRINVVMSVMDDYLDGKKYIVPGLGDFGDRYFGTQR